MKIIVIDEEFPYPLNTGKRIRSFNLISRLARKHELRYVAFGSAGSESFDACKRAGIEPIAAPGNPPPKSGPGFYLKLAANLFSRLPYSVSSHYQQSLVHAINSEIGRDRPDIIIAEWGPYANYLRTLTGIPTLVVAHNVETDIWRRYFENESNGPRKWYIGLQADKMERFEEWAFRSADGVTAVSPHDADTIKRYCGSANVSVVENGVDLDYFKATGSRQTGTDRLVFTGSMDWRPNWDAVHFFIADIYPLLKKVRPRIEAVFVGRNPPPEISAYDKMEGITITGTVDDVRPYISGSDLYIVPLRIGGGSRLKILEALAMKMAVVSTAVGAEGLETTDETDILIADSPEDFVAAIDRLLKDRELAAKLGEAGRKLVEDRYGWDALSEKLNQFVLSLADSK